MSHYEALTIYQLRVVKAALYGYINEQQRLADTEPEQAELHRMYIATAQEVLRSAHEEMYEPQVLCVEHLDDNGEEV